MVREVVLLTRGRDPRRVVGGVEPGVNYHASVSPSSGQSLDRALGTARCEQGASEADPEGVEAASPDAALDDNGMQEVLEVAVRGGVEHGGKIAVEVKVGVWGHLGPLHSN